MWGKSIKPDAEMTMHMWPVDKQPVRPPGWPAGAPCILPTPITGSAPSQRHQRNQAGKRAALLDETPFHSVNTDEVLYSCSSVPDIIGLVEGRQLSSHEESTSYGVKSGRRKTT
ncbi:hypothetical protein MCOR25_007222 [Pyricularia grisea]|nr:hypothetical protein MCOR25_007222 [Pyricularia grisea]